MKRYLINYGPGAGSLAYPSAWEFETSNSAIQAIEDIADEKFIHGGGGTHRAGWPFSTLHKTTSSTANASGMLPSNFDMSLVATIYEIDVPEGKTARQVYGAWHAEQERTETEARTAELSQMKRFALAHLPFVYEGSLKIGRDEYIELMVDGETSLQYRVIETLFAKMRDTDLGYVNLDLGYDEFVNLGTVRITIERVESETDEA